MLDIFILQCFLANPAGLSRDVDLLTLALNIISLEKSIQFRFYYYASNILLHHNKSIIYINLRLFLYFPRSVNTNLLYYSLAIFLSLPSKLQFNTINISG